MNTNKPSKSPIREKRRDTVMNTNRPKPFIKIDDDETD